MMNVDQILRKVSAEKVIEAIEALKKTTLNEDAIEEVKAAVKLLAKCGFMTVSIPAGKVVYRGRPWAGPGNPIYKTVSEISYPKKDVTGKLKLNRASTNKHSPFYGAIGTPDMQAPHVVAVTEVQSGEGPDGYEYIAIGQWLVKRDITVASLALHSNIAKVNSQAQEMLKFHKEASQFVGERGDIIQKVAEFMSTEFSKDVGNHLEYLISACYGDELFDYGIEGIMFPSVKGDGKTFNVALTQSAVEDALEIRVASMARTRRKNDTIVAEWFLNSPVIVDGNLKWVEPVAPLLKSDEMEWMLNH